MKKFAFLRAGLLAGFLVPFGTSPANAQTSTNPNFFVDAVYNGVPGSTYKSPFATDGKNTVYSYNNVTVGQVSQGEFDQLYSNFVVLDGQLTLGDAAGSNGQYYLGSSGTPGQASSTIFQAASIVIGNAGQGAFSQQTATLVFVNTISFGAQVPSSSDSYTLGGGLLVAFQVGQNTGTTASGTFTFFGGTLVAVGNNATFMQGLSAAYVSGGATIDNGGFNITIAQPLLNGGFAIDGGVATKGTGTLTLTGNNTYTGPTAMNGGTLNAGNAAALGNGGTITFGGGTLQYSAASSGVDFSSRFSSAGNQAVSLDTNGQSVTIGYGFGGTGTSLTKLGAGTLTINGGNSYTGATTLRGGTTLVNNQGALGNGGTITFGGGTLQYGDTSHSDSDYNNADFSARFNTGSNQVYNVNTGSHNIVYATGLTSGNGSLTKTGTGTLSLNGGNTYPGDTNVQAGTLLLNNTNTGRGKIFVDGTTPVLGGTGSTTSAVTVHNGAINPGGNVGAAGASTLVGNLSVGSLTLDNHSTFALDVNSATMYDVLISGGDVTLNNSALNVNINPNAAFSNGQTLDLIHLTGGKLGGTFAGVANNGTYTFGGNPFQAVYTQTDFELVAVPEPVTSLAGALVVVVGGASVLRRRRV